MKNIILGFIAGLIIGTCIPAFAVSDRMTYRAELTQIKVKLADRSATAANVARGLELLIALNGY